MNHHTPIRDEASLILSGMQRDTLGQTMADMAAALLPARHPVELNPNTPVIIQQYIHGEMVTIGGPYWNADTAKAASSVGRWIELPDGGWRSEDGRTIIQPEGV